MMDMNYSQLIAKKPINRTAVIVALISGLLAAALALFILRHPFFPGDLAFTHFWQSHANPPLTDAMKAITYIFGDWRAAVLTTVAVIIIAWKVGKTAALAVALSGLLTLFNYLFKSLIARPRPSAGLVKVLVQESNYSFPSSHAFFSIIFLGIIIYILNKQLKKGPLKLVLSLLLAFLILVVGFTRVYLGVHWYSDMLAGYLFGAFFLCLLVLGFESWNRRRPV
jgi:undecaprenyl-diphosphatase